MTRAVTFGGPVDELPSGRRTRHDYEAWLRAARRHTGRCVPVLFDPPLKSPSGVAIAARKAIPDAEVALVRGQIYVRATPSRP